MASPWQKSISAKTLQKSNNTTTKTASTVEKYDLIVIGGGPAGYVAAIKGKRAGFKVAVIEEERVGGSCIHKGCIPTKSLWGTAVHIRRLNDSEEHGVKLSKISFDFKTAMRRQFAISDTMSKQIENRMERLNIQVICGRAGTLSRTKSGRFFRIPIKPSKGAEKEVTAKFVLIATGSRPAESAPLISDHKKIITTDDFVKLEKLPKHLVIAGGGVIACEFASILTQFGVKIELLEHSGQALSAMDPEVVDVLYSVFKRDGVVVHLNTKTKAIHDKKDGITVEVDSAGKTKKIDTDMVLIAIGRKPNSDGLGLQELGVKMTDRGHICVNEKLETGCKGIYAAGDVIGGITLAHKAWYDADIAIRAMAGEEVATNYQTVPAAIFTVPEMASVGVTHEQAMKSKKKISVGRFYYKENAQALCVGKTLGLIKVVVDRDSDRILGCSIVGHDSSNLISEVALAMAAGLRASHICDAIHPHPSLSEMIHEAFLDAHDRSIHKL